MEFIVKLFAENKESYYYASGVDVERIGNQRLLHMIFSNRTIKLKLGSDTKEIPSIPTFFLIDGKKLLGFEIYNGIDSKLLDEFHFTNKDAGSEIDMPQIIVGRKYDQTEEIIDLIDKAINEGNESLYIDHYVSDSSWLEIEMKYKGIAAVKFQKLPMLERDTTGNYYKLTILKTDHATTGN